MRISLIGPPQSGKTTLFGAVTRRPVKTGAAGYSEGAHLAVVEVPDRRVDALTAMYHPRKQTYASVEFLDPPTQTGRSSGFSGRLLEELRLSDALLGAVRAFHSDLVPNPNGGIDPLREYRDLEADLIIADLQLVETRLERMEKDRRAKGNRFAQAMASERQALKRAQAHLEQELPLHSLEMSETDAEALGHLTFLTQKPMIVVANISEEDLGQEAPASLQPMREWAERAGTPTLAMCAAVEQEIAALEPEEEADYLSAMGIEESGRYRLLRALYELLGLISFFTVGDDEVRAWTLRKGDNALTAAGKIHTDLARGFIRAEVIPCNDLLAAGDPRTARQEGKFRLEMKNYVVQDGDLLDIRFSV